MSMREIAAYDVVVVGSGIAGTSAAVSAAEADPRLRVAILSNGPLFSGSSFASSTWGMGLVSAGAQGQEESLVRQIMAIGQGRAEEHLVRSFVSGIEPAVARAESWGITFRQPSAQAQGEKEYIPCFDVRHRRWRGLERESWRKALGTRICALGITVFEHHELIDILQDDRGGVSSAVAFDHRTQDFVLVQAKSLILATGGIASAFKGHIAGPDNTATAQAMAVACGARVVNLDCLQYMPTIVSPVDGVVFNEKMFRQVSVAQDVQEWIERESGMALQEVLEMRSGYGPTTKRLPSYAVDRAILNAGEDGLPIKIEPANPAPEFVKTYCDWLEYAYGVKADEPLRLGLRAQASNGGILVDEAAGTNVPGLYACGECTGGMHGADRVGGLSSANALVFGIRAGESAAKYALAAAGVPASSCLPAWANGSPAECAHLRRQELRQETLRLFDMSSR